MSAGNLTYYAHQLGGNVAGSNRVLCPGPGHGRTDRSLSVTFNNDGSFVTYSFAGDDFKDCRDHVKALLGLSDDRPVPIRETPEIDVSMLVDEKKRISYGLSLWAQAKPISGTIAETYLAGRGLTYEGEALRFHPSIKYTNTNAFHPTMLALVTDSISGEPAGIHRTFLTSEGKKIDRKMLGRAKGGVIRLWGDEDVTDGLAIAEGIETALATGHTPIWATMTSGIMKEFPVLSGIECLTIFADNDIKGAGVKAANACGRRWHDAGRAVTINMPADMGKDFADILEEAA
ncbi:toprim domain-containing protein [Phyllobacterium sp. A18/5-2]|uniref:DUF7146 domain-containing protein n=1 Tax=Phyllobacterium sp. A18/5-2 TaxID=2978392 RepID=UPI0021CA0686|nr:toprim domain-containing protein [Phyllobacterium sp. A18/5-2]UXN62889.1 toprim domain-containing protein [Phyllobacterium sp. A18/5-2]